MGVSGYHTPASDIGYNTKYYGGRENNGRGVGLFAILSRNVVVDLKCF